jgi:hypothetical protein
MQQGADINYRKCLLIGEKEFWIRGQRTTESICPLPTPFRGRYLGFREIIENILNY